MKFFYTNSVKFNQTQLDSSKSLGGYISSSVIPNNLVGNIFGDLTAFTKNQNQDEFRALAIQNDGTVTLTGLRVFLDIDDQASGEGNDFSYELGYLSPSTDDCGDLLSELLPNPYAQPYTVTFYNVDGEVNALALPNLDAGDYFVFYIKRTLLDSSLQPLTTDQYVAILNKTLVLPTKETIPLIVKWT